MLRLALKMIMGDKAKYVGILIGLTFAAFIITQQAAIFVGIMSRTFGYITDTSQPDIWVMDKKVQYIDDIKPMRDTQLFRVRGVDGVEWAVPLYRGIIRARLKNGNFENCIISGIDDATLIGGPPKMIEGDIKDLRAPDAIIVNEVGAATKLATEHNSITVPLKIGDVLEINDYRAVVRGICETGRTFQSQPVIYTTYARATTFAPQERKLLSFILVKSGKGISPELLCKRIMRETNLAAYTSHQFKNKTVKYYLINTGIAVNFGVAVILGFFIGVAIAGQTFYNFTIDNLRYFGTFKALGATNDLLTRMIALQGLMVGALGWGLGVGAAALFGFVTLGTELSFALPWQLLLISGISMLFICMAAAFFSIRKVVRLEPAIVFKT